MFKKPFKLIDIIDAGFDFLEGIFDCITNGITITNSEATILYVNDAFTTITGYSQEEVLNNNPGMLHSGRHGKEFYTTMWHHIHKDGYWSGEIWNRHKAGHLLPEWITITKLTNKEKTYYISVFSDITSLVEKNKEIMNLAYKDALTGLYNRSYLNESFKMYCNKFYRRSNEKKQNFALLFMDVNGFKKINDTYGHLAGDYILMSTANAIKSALRKFDIALRYGGDEFIVLLDNIKDFETINNVGQRIAEALKTPFTYEGNAIKISISIGVSIYPDDGHELKQLIELADKAMYKSKKNKKFMNFHNDNYKY